MRNDKKSNRDGYAPDSYAEALLHSLQRSALIGMSGAEDNSGGVDFASSLERIIQTANRLFSEQGYDATSISNIAREAGVNKALIYYYFEDKQALYKEVIDSALADLLKIWNRDEVNRGTASDRLAAYLRAAVNLMKDNSAIAPLIFSEIIQKGEMQEYIVKNFFLPNAYNLVSLINEGAEQGHFKKLENPIPVIPAIMGGLFIVSREADIGLGVGLPVFSSGEDRFDSYIDYVLKGLSV